MTIRWSDTDIDLLKAYCARGIQGHPAELRAKYSAYAIRTKAHKLGLVTKHRKPVRARIQDDLSRVPAIELSYIAGIFDGEGWISISSRSKYASYWMIGIGSTCLPVLEFIQKRIPTSHIKTRQIVLNRKQGYEFVITGQLCIYDFLSALLPYLIIRKDRALEAMAAIRSKWPNLCDS